MSQALPFSEAIESNGIVYISGQIGVDPATNALPASGFAAEADQVMKNLGAVLGRQGLGYGDLVNVTIYLKSMENYAAANEEYRKYFSGRFPARVCIAVHDLPFNASIEIAGVAQRK
jgi:reactive intermediate/imine deaminase